VWLSVYLSDLNQRRWRWFLNSAKINWCQLAGFMLYVFFFNIEQGILRGDKKIKYARTKFFSLILNRVLHKIIGLQ
jgi:hypothetical protein